MTAKQKVVQRRLILILLFPIIISGMGAAIAYIDAFQMFREYVIGGVIPDELVSSGRTGKELRLLEYRSLVDIDLEGFDKNLPADDMPSTILLNTMAAQSGLATLSVSIKPDYLLNRDSGLLPNYQERGRGWERPAYMSFFEEGKLRLASGVGLRVHGEKSRAARIKSFRLHFRELYGSADVSSDTFFEGVNDSLDSIIAHADVRNIRANQSVTAWQFMNPIAYQLAETIGCIAPDTKPVTFYINGDYQGLYVMTERITDSFLRRRFGHDNFVLARMKWDRTRGSTGLQKGSPQLYEDYLSWPSTVPAPMTVSAVEKMIDLDSLTNWMISILYVGATDPFQGAVILDETDPSARWQYVNWDMDHAFMDLYDQVLLDWEIDNFAGVSAILKSQTTRAIVFNRLRQESAEYRIRFLSRMVEVLNHVLTIEKVGEIIERYEHIAEQHTIDDTSFFYKIAEFTKMRPVALREQLDQYFGAGTAYLLTIENRSPDRITVDGYEIGSEYSGWYFADTPVRINTVSPGEMATQTLIVNGVEKSIGDNDFSFNLSRDTELLVR